MRTTSTTMFYLLFTYFLLSSNSLGITMAGRAIPSSVPSTMMPPLDSQGEDYVERRPLSNHRRPFFGTEPDVKGCLPKGYRHSSAPSRYVNNLPLISCSKLHGKR
jgi:hypothetical protein